VIRIVLFPTCCDATERVNEPTPDRNKRPGAKKKAALCGLSLTAPGPPGVGSDDTGLCE